VPIDTSLQPTANAASKPLTPSVSEKETSRVLPRISFQWMLGIVTLGAVVAFTLRQATLGSPLGIAIMHSLATVALTFAGFALLFLIAWFTALTSGNALDDVRVGNPFSTDQLPPQVLPPREPGT
jgi:hypothetical protein